MIDREEVEALLAECASEYRFPKPLPHVIEELCRAWLALDAAPVASVDTHGGNVIAHLTAAGYYLGRSVRLVPEAE